MVNVLKKRFNGTNAFMDLIFVLHDHLDIFEHEPKI
jgi:hypothetical protein